VEGSELFKIYDSAIKVSNGKKCKWISYLANILHIADTELASVENFPLIQNSKVMLVSIMFQNVMHPKNSHRREAVASKQYVEFKNE
jgi:hypothetical protein